MSETTNDVTRPLPVPTAESQPFWDGCRRRELLLQRCATCTRAWFPPAGRCPHCLSTDWAWAPVSGRGTVYSFVVYRRAYHPWLADRLPYVVAVVALDEGPRMISNVVGCDPAAVTCDAPVEVVFEDVAEGVTLPLFRLRGS